ncbi:uncharacterized protein N7515_002543 [Penicillium bovifimosum]|uniref:Enoyl reductase (ER) domain-containing protein n=1 Tax=Penicillium bovifimosum TaxID=126998 RepID=A0A9W9HBR3_9EURO|nr:uncharacterized protein N7515_002543 [Penicillium bovifimosum]KAJ5143756.1 hypothetical protein N7515_002543 [Penicillium bovifimosum]
MAVPRIQIAAVIEPTKTDASAKVGIRSNRPVPLPGKGEILVQLEYSGVCHSDIHSIRGDTPMLTDVAGHEGIGKVVAVGLGVDEIQWMGTCVGIRWLYSSCGQCEICEINHTACPYQKNAGANVPGTFQQYIVSPAQHVTKIPEQLSPDSAAPLLCAGIAMYSSIMKTKTRPGDYLAILGAGGGLGHMGIQIAAKKGLKVIAIDSGEKKKQLCLSLGASEFLDFREVGIVKEVKAKTKFGVHAVICTANGERAYEQSMQMLRPLGTLVCVGIPSSPFKLPATPFDMIVKGQTIVGNSAGTAAEMDELLAMAVAGDVKAHIDVYQLDDINEVLDRLERSEIDGRVVLRIPQ